MRNAHATLLGVFFGAGLFAVGCGGASTGGPAVGTAEARLVLSSQGSNAATLHVTATDDASSTVALDKTIVIQGSGATVVDVTLPSGSYTFSVGVLGGASGNVTLGSSSTDIDLTSSATTQINVAAQTAADGSAQVQIGADVAPVINGVDVQLTGQGTSAAVNITVDATAEGGGALTFFWSGAGLQGASQGQSSISIPVSAISAGANTAAQNVVHVIVQDVQGTTTEADVALTLAGNAVQGTTSAASNASAAVAACVNAQAACNAGCSSGLGLGQAGASANASCLSQCTLALASCEAQ